ncbi:alkaline phosphatase family protein [Marmoricola sp. RAF53]|uniref:alkaline phosphatase family protein n=1 Tax=Marmoricola sp. RAF53 TaxID=3233059 RepID=UPI003F9AE81F
MVRARSRWRLRAGDVGRLLLAWLISVLALMIADWLQPELSATSPWCWVAVAAVAGVVGMVLRPVLVELSARIGWVAILLVTVAGQALVMYVALRSVPGVTTTPWSALGTAWITAFIGTALTWLVTAGTDDGLVASLARRGSRSGAEVPDPDVDGLLIVQMDGVPFPVLHWAVQSGGVPTLRRWLSDGSYHLHEWTPQLPCTTPASQMGVLHGTVEGIPAFRWYDRELGRLLVANKPGDAAVIEQRGTSGRGLLVDDGVSISNLFTGDAPRSMLTMSRLGGGMSQTSTRRVFGWFVVAPQGFARSLARTFAEIVKERWQAKRQDRRKLEPRMKRGWTFAGLRAVTNALLRDVNTALVAEEMRRGTKVIYVNYVDYDEIAHHAGMFRPESLAALDGVDRVLGSLEELSRLAPRRYRIIAISDHGQSQGRSFEDAYGKSLGALCEELIALKVQTVDAPVEGWGRAESVVGDVAGSGGLTGRIATQAEKSIERGRDQAEERAVATATEDGPVVLGSGNLGLFYVREKTRLSLDELDRRWPHLVPGLTEHPGIGFVAGLDDDGVPWALGAGGRRNLADGTVEGDDPLAAYGERAPRLLARAVLMPESPDLYVNSSVAESTLDVHAFEDLVGAHGGLGGWQDSAVLLVPADLDSEAARDLEGADALHRFLVSVLEGLGHRRTIAPRPAPAPAGSRAETA